MKKLRCFLGTVLTCVIAARLTWSEPLTYTINTKKWSHLLDDHFISITINPTDLLQGRPFGLGMNSTLEILKGLSPAYIRFGSADTNKYTFKKSRYPNDVVRPEDAYTITEDHWTSLNEVAKSAGLDIIVCLNAAHRDAVTNRWDTRNSLDLISFSDSKGYNLTWQLGYEVQASEDLSGVQFGRDLNRLRTILNAFPRYQNAKLIGPDIKVVHKKEDVDFVSEMLIEAGPTLDAVTWHPRWPQPSKMKVAENSELGYEFPTDHLEWDRVQLNKVLQRTIFKNPVWIGEPKSESTGTFAEGLLWARRLVLAAKLGVEVVMKHPSLMDVSHPKPEYWIALMHKRFLGKSVLETRSINNHSDVSVVAHCTNSYYWSNDEEGAITLYAVNIGGSEQKVMIKAGWSGRSQLLHQYLLTSGSDPDSVFSQMTYMNGEPLMMTEDGRLPEIAPLIRRIERSVTLRIPPYSVGFWVLPEAKVRICQMQPVSIPMINLETLNPANVIKTTQKGLQNIRNINQFIVDKLTNPVSEEDGGFGLKSKESKNVLYDTESVEFPFERRIRRIRDINVSNMEELGRELRKGIERIHDLLESENGKREDLPADHAAALRAAEDRIDGLANDLRSAIRMTNQEEEFGKFLDSAGLRADFGQLMMRERGISPDRSVFPPPPIWGIGDEINTLEEAESTGKRPKRQLEEEGEEAEGEETEDSTAESEEPAESPADRAMEPKEPKKNSIGVSHVSLKELESRYKNLIANHIGKNRKKLEEIRKKGGLVQKPGNDVNTDLQEDILMKEIEVLEKTEQAMTEILKNQKKRQDALEEIIKEEIHDIKNDRIMALEEVREKKQTKDESSTPKRPKAHRLQKKMKNHGDEGRSSENESKRRRDAGERGKRSMTSASHALNKLTNDIKHVAHGSDVGIVNSPELNLEEYENELKRVISKIIRESKIRLQEIKNNVESTSNDLTQSSKDFNADLEAEMLEIEVHALEEAYVFIDTLFLSQKKSQDVFEKIIKDEIQDVKRQHVMTLGNPRNKRQMNEERPALKKRSLHQIQRKTKGRNEAENFKDVSDEENLKSNEIQKRATGEKEEKTAKKTSVTKTHQKEQKDENSGEVKEEKDKKVDVIRKFILKQGDRAKEWNSLKNHIRENYEKKHKKSDKASGEEKKASPTKHHSSEESSKEENASSEEIVKKSHVQEDTPKHKKSHKKHHDDDEDKSSEEIVKKSHKKHHESEEDSVEVKKSKKHESSSEEVVSKEKKKAIPNAPLKEGDEHRREYLLKSISDLVDKQNTRDHSRRRHDEEEMSEEINVDPISKMSKRKPRKAENAKRATVVAEDDENGNHKRFRLRSRLHKESGNDDDGDSAYRKRRLISDQKHENEAEMNKTKERIKSKIFSKFSPRVDSTEMDESNEGSNDTEVSTTEKSEITSGSESTVAQEETTTERSEPQEEILKATQTEAAQLEPTQATTEPMTVPENTDRRRRRRAIDLSNMSSEERVKEFKRMVQRKINNAKRHPNGLNAIDPDQFLKMAGSTVRVMFDDVIPEAYDQTKDKIRNLGISDYFKEFGKIVEELKHLDDIFINIGHSAVKSYLRGDRSDHVQTLRRFRRSADGEETIEKPTGSEPEMVMQPGNEMMGEDQFPDIIVDGATTPIQPSQKTEDPPVPDSHEQNVEFFREEVPETNSETIDGGIIEDHTPQPQVSEVELTTSTEGPQNPTEITETITADAQEFATTETPHWEEQKTPSVIDPESHADIQGHMNDVNDLNSLIPKTWKERRFPMRPKFDREATLKSLRESARNRFTKRENTPGEMEEKLSPWARTTKDFIQQALNTLQRQRELSEMLTRESVNELMKREIARKVIGKRQVLDDHEKKGIVKRQLVPIYGLGEPNRKREVPPEESADSARFLRQLQPGVYVVPTKEMTNVRSEQVHTEPTEKKPGMPNVVTLNIYYDKKKEEATVSQQQPQETLPQQIDPRLSQDYARYYQQTAYAPAPPSAPLPAPAQYIPEERYVPEERYTRVMEVDPYANYGRNDQRTYQAPPPPPPPPPPPQPQPVYSNYYPEYSKIQPEANTGWSTYKSRQSPPEINSFPQDHFEPGWNVQYGPKQHSSKSSRKSHGTSYNEDEYRMYPDKKRSVQNMNPKWSESALPFFKYFLNLAAEQREQADTSSLETTESNSTEDLFTENRKRAQVKTPKQQFPLLSEESVQSEHKLVKRSYPTIVELQEQVIPEWYDTYQFQEQNFPQHEYHPDLLSEEDIEFILDDFAMDEEEDNDDDDDDYGYYIMNNMIYQDPLLKRRRRSTDSIEKMLKTNTIEKAPLLDTDRVIHKIVAKKDLKKLTDEDSSLEVPHRKSETTTESSKNIMTADEAKKIKKEDDLLLKYLKYAYDTMVKVMRSVGIL